MDTKALANLLRKLDEQSFRPGDSVVASTINHPIDAIGKFGGWLANQVNTAAGIPDQYDNPYPYLAPSPEAQTQAAFDVAGMAQLGSMPFAPKSAGGTVGTFIGPKAATWDAEKAAAASKLLDEGADPAQVWREHLIGRMPDGALFSEIPDNKAFYRGSGAAGSSYADNVYLHPELFDNYPGFKNYTVREFEGAGGSFNDTAPELSIGQRDASSTMAHELQHAIQQREGWARGGSPGDKIPLDVVRESVSEFLKPEFDRLLKIGRERQARGLGNVDPVEAYRRLTGEAQARATQDRLNMSMDERRNNYPLAGGKLSDIPLEQLIYRYGDNGPAMAIDAWHGSPHKFDEFDMSKIGTGEGAQAYGHGLYFAESPEVAVQYQKNIADTQGYTKYKGQTRNALVGRDRVIYDYLTEYGGARGAADALEAQIKNGSDFDDIDYLKNLKSEILKNESLFESGGNLYKTSLEWPDPAREAADPLGPHHFLDWDKPLSEQSPEVQAAIEKMKGGFISHPKPTTMGKELHNMAMWAGKGIPSSVASAENLAANGIPGIRYLDSGSRGAGDGSYNYVVFDDKIPKIVERNGQPVNALAQALRDDNLNAELLQKYLQQGSLTPDELAQYERNAVAMRDSNRQYLNVANADAQGGTAMDRARDMGFDIDNPYYHATNSNQDWSVFDPNKAPSGEGVMFAADDPGAASWFAPGNNSRVMPVLLNKKNYGEKVNLNGDFEAQIYENFLKKIKEDEIDFAIFNNVNDPIPMDKLVMAKQPYNNFRSLFAAFDPLRKDSADLLATKLLPASMLGLGMYGMEQERRNPLAEALRGQ